MRMDGINDVYFFKAMNDKEGIALTIGCKASFGGWSGVVIDREKFKKEMTVFLEKI